MIFHFRASCGSVVGSGCSNNEDNFYFDGRHLAIPNQGMKYPMKQEGTTDIPVVLAVFDGMGGESGGDEAACIVSEVFSNEYKKMEEIARSGKAFMLDACDAANRAVDQARVSRQVSRMGATVAALHLSYDEIVACNVGDSKIFRLRDKQLLQISQDHTDAHILSAMGVEKKPVLLQYLGMPETEMTIDPYVSRGELMPGDTYMLCSDGVTDAVAADVLFDLLSGYDPYEASRRILELVREKNAFDSATIIVVTIDNSGV